MSNFKDVHAWMHKFGQVDSMDLGKPSFPDPKTVHLRVDLIDEEVDELKQAIADNDIVAVADALTDILVVTYGAGVAFNIDLDACHKEVDASNHSKAGEDGNPIYREDGKIMKGPNYFPPNLEKVLFP